ncbi:MAG: efflux RND transporter periplasmic adaptor subunit [Phycisphaerales bacterium]|nr:efflux RND transporter periplasmic adaptor subunit [Phycisphaerales bacterium]
MAAPIWLAVLLSAAAAVAQGPPPTPVRVDAARKEMVQERRMVTGELRPMRQARVATEEPGLVQELAVQEGQAVKRGDVLARLNRQRLEIELLNIQAQEKVAAAEVQERQAEAAWRQRDLETYRNLSQRQATNPKELYDAEAQSNIASARLEAARQQITAIQARSELIAKRIADTNITAPFDGVVVAKLVEQGEWVDEGAAVVHLVSSGEIEAWLDVPQQFAGAIIGKQTTIAVSIEATGAMLESSQARAIPQVDPKARSFSLIVRLKNDDGALAPGMSITGWAPTGRRGEHLTISKDGVLRNDVGPYVYVARKTAPAAAAAAAPVNIEILFAHQDRFVVRSQAIAPGDLIIVEGNERLFPMAPVSFIAGPAAAVEEPGGADPNADGKRGGR